MFIVGSRVRTSIIGCVYKKSLRLSASARKKAEVGTLTNLMAVNAQMLADLTLYLNIVWSAPFQIIICLFMLWSYLGVSALIG
jgi:ATP-binding cassette subfamily C (CFTR/MRP) protein 1